MTYLQIMNNSGWKVNYLSDLIQQLINEGWNIRKEREKLYSPTMGSPMSNPCLPEKARMGCAIGN